MNKMNDSFFQVHTYAVGLVLFPEDNLINVLVYLLLLFGYSLLNNVFCFIG